MKIAALVDNLMVGQEAFYLIKNFNELSKVMSNQTYCFYNNLSTVCVQPLFAVMNTYYIDHFNNGKIVCTNFNNLKTLIKLNNKCEKYFYVWDLEWLRGGYKYMEQVSLMRDPSINLLARSESHANIIENYCNRSVLSIVDDWNYKQLEKI
jgi:hypothetical protein